MAIIDVAGFVANLKEHENGSMCTTAAGLIGALWSLGQCGQVTEP